jgi:hypothetical protein
VRAVIPGQGRGKVSGSILLRAVAAQAPEIEIACRGCPRHDRPRPDKLLEDHGPEIPMPMPLLPRLLAGDCPKVASLNLYERCDVHSPTLSALFAA